MHWNCSTFRHGCLRRRRGRARVCPIGSLPWITIIRLVGRRGIVVLGCLPEGRTVSYGHSSRRRKVAIYSRQLLWRRTVDPSNVFPLLLSEGKRWWLRDLWIKRSLRICTKIINRSICTLCIWEGTPTLSVVSYCRTITALEGRLSWRVVIGTEDWPFGLYHHRPMGKAWTVPERIRPKNEREAKEASTNQTTTALPSKR
mmetsp:Transcript_28463/g.59323  ORF Transcript_28463/g.59323 Transcript_28463/m.59323 type:complete len:200 (-) Transcript_28463:516-1115(-)